MDPEKLALEKLDLEETEQLQKVERVRGKLKERVASLDEVPDAYGRLTDDYFVFRRRVLDGIDDQPVDEGNDDEAVVRINDVLFGGNILADSEIIADLRAELEQYNQRFQEIYDIESQVFKKIPLEYESVRAIYDFRAHVRLLNRWKNAEGEGKAIATEIEKKCTEVIKRWESYWANEEEPPSTFGQDTDEAAKKVKELYDRFKVD